MGLTRWPRRHPTEAWFAATCTLAIMYGAASAALHLAGEAAPSAYVHIIVCTLFMMSAIPSGVGMYLVSLRREQQRQAARLMQRQDEQTQWLQRQMERISRASVERYLELSPTHPIPLSLLRPAVGGAAQTSLPAQARRGGRAAVTPTDPWRTPSAPTPVSDTDDVTRDVSEMFEPYLKGFYQGRKATDDDGDEPDPKE